jgi:hypothetical protein
MEGKMHNYEKVEKLFNVDDIKDVPNAINNMTQEDYDKIYNQMSKMVYDCILRSRGKKTG